MPPLLVISGPSGVGKGTILSKLEEKYSPFLDYSVSYTTRTPRHGEEGGRNYFFISRDEFREKLEKGEFLEFAEFSGNFYGTPMDEVVRLNRNPEKIGVLEVELNGVEQLQSKTDLSAYFIFIQPPSFDVLGQRLRNRGTEEENDMEARLNKAKEELRRMQKLKSDLMVVNDKLEDGVMEIMRFIEEKYPFVNYR